MTFTILIACSANVCRSPLASAVLAHAVALEQVDRSVSVVTGGLEAIAGQPACPEIARMAEARGLHSRSLVRHEASILTPDEIGAADLVLTADRRARSGVMKRMPFATGRTFTIREAAQLGAAALPEVRGHTLDDRLRSYVAAMNDVRGLSELPRTRRMVVLTSPWRRLAVHAHDIPDAHQGERAPHRAVYSLTASSSKQVARDLSTCAQVSVG
ncbi:hypothetical protein [Nocardioides caricicola]|uniref:Phosphotyrosine protein phosphatase I domain-containing protein n=1 Tax=Nocardioides caricicola TaxID=634770 RepID=A0ABW0MVU8_9ACTN